MKHIPYITTAALLAATMSLSLGLLEMAQAEPVGTAFTYQGHLTESGLAAEGSFDFELALYDVAAGGVPIDIISFEDVPVGNGLFQLHPNYTGVPFEAGVQYWLEARVRAGDSTGGHTALLPRQALNPTPYAISAQTILAPVDIAGDINVQGEITVGNTSIRPDEVRTDYLEAEEVFSDGPVYLHGPVDFFGGATIQRINDSMALLVENDGGTQPALLVRTETPEDPAASIEGSLSVTGQMQVDGPTSLVRNQDQVAVTVENQGPNQPALVVSSDSDTNPAARVEGSMVVQGNVAAQANISCSLSGGCLEPDELKPGLYRSRSEIYTGTNTVDVPPGEFRRVDAFCADDNDLPLAGDCKDSGLDVVGQLALDWTDTFSTPGWQCTFDNPGSTQEFGITTVYCIAKPGGN